MTADVQRELAQVLLSVPWDASYSDTAAALLPTVQRLIADAEKRAAAAALRDAYWATAAIPDAESVRDVIRARGAALDLFGAADEASG